MGGLGFTNPVQSADSEYEASVSIMAPLVNQLIVALTHEPADEEEGHEL